MAVHKTQEELKKEFRIEETTEGIVITGWLNEDVNCLIPDECCQNTIRVLLI